MHDINEKKSKFTKKPYIYICRSLKLQTLQSRIKNTNAQIQTNALYLPPQRLTRMKPACIDWDRRKRRTKYSHVAAISQSKFTERGWTWKHRLSQRSRTACHTCIIMLLSFPITMYAFDRQTDGRTDRQTERRQQQLAL